MRESSGHFICPHFNFGFWFRPVSGDGCEKVSAAAEVFSASFADYRVERQLTYKGLAQTIVTRRVKEMLMPLIGEKDQETIRQHFAANLAGAVEVVLFTERESPIIVPSLQPCETCKDTEDL